MGFTPVLVEQFKRELQGYDSSLAEYLTSGFENGFSLCSDAPRVNLICKNLKSAIENPMIVSEKISKEISAGRVAGPFAEPPFENFRTSPIGLVPKKEPGEFRMIHHLSYPPHESVNDYIDPDLCSVQYTKFDAAVKMIQKLGKGALLGKADIRSAFRLIPMSEQDFPLLGFTHEGLYFFDKMLPFGASISCSVFEKFATALQWIVRNNCSQGELDHYLDDFLFGGRAQTQDCLHLMQTFFDCCRRLGVPVSDEKTVWPTTILVFLGLELDSVLMLVRIPALKIEKLITQIENLLLHKKSVQLKEMQSLIGSLNFLCRAIVPGRPFCRRLINSTCGVTKPYHHIRIKPGMRQDLVMWLTFLKSFNGISMFHDQFWTFSSDICMYTDSSAAEGHGFGITFLTEWTFGIWPKQWHTMGITKDITLLEFFPLLVAILIWGEVIQNKKILFKCDNQSVVNIVNNQSSKSDKIMVLVRAFTLHCLKWNIMFKAEYVPGIDNTLADSLSRLQIERFRRLHPTADPEPKALPDHVWNILNRE